MSGPVSADGDDERARIRRATLADEHELRELYIEYIRILAEWNPEAHGELEDVWFTRPERLHPYVLSGADGRVDGFALVMGREYAEAMGCDGDHYFHALLVRDELRGRGAADELTRWIFERHTGRWCLEVLRENERAVGFWRRVLAPHSAAFEERPGPFHHVHFDVSAPTP